jgi:excisionase family DNA binding protein
MSEKYYTVEEIAELIKIHPKTIQRYIREGRLKANKVGKSWRVSGHDLSTFTEGGNASVTPPLDFNGKAVATEKADREIKVSTVIDIPVSDTQEAVRIANTLTALANSKPPGWGASSLQTQYLMPDNMMRVMVWGGLNFAQIILDSVAMLTERGGDDV